MPVPRARPLRLGIRESRRPGTLSAVAPGRCMKNEESAFWVRVKPRSRMDALVGREADGTWQIRVQAPLFKGAANERCRRLLARVLEVPLSWIRVEVGEGARRKRVSVSGLGAEEVCRRLLRAVDEVENRRG